MQITVFGASGKVGSLVVELALKRGYKVVAFVHNHDLFVPSNDLLVQKGDVYNSDSVAAALRGSEAVISCLGSWGTPSKSVLTSAMRAIIPAMREHKIKRIVTLTGHGAEDPHVIQGNFHKLMMRVLLPFPAGKVFRDGEEHMRLLAESDLDWTTIRSPIMTNYGRKGYHLIDKPHNPLASISRSAVAAALLDQVELTTDLKSAPSMYRTRLSSIGSIPKV